MLSKLRENKLLFIPSALITLAVLVFGAVTCTSSDQLEDDSQLSSEENAAEQAEADEGQANEDMADEEAGESEDYADEGDAATAPPAEPMPSEMDGDPKYSPPATPMKQQEEKKPDEADGKGGIISGGAKPQKKGVYYICEEYKSKKKKKGKVFYGCQAYYNGGGKAPWPNHRNFTLMTKGRKVVPASVIVGGLGYSILFEVDDAKYRDGLMPVESRGGN